VGVVDDEQSHGMSGDSQGCVGGKEKNPGVGNIRENECRSLTAFVKIKRLITFNNHEAGGRS